MRKPSTAHRSRRAPPLKDSDYDHEINLVDHAAEAVTPQALSPEPGQGQQPDQPGQSAEQRPTSTAQSESQQGVAAAEQDREAADDSGEGPSASQRAPLQHSPARRRTSGASSTSRRSRKASKKAASQESLARNAALPELQITEPTPLVGPQRTHSDANGTQRRKPTPETAIDILYENERGGMFCGIPLFSPKALGQLDPPNWTNFAHKPSPTSIHTAQVPDPSWVWSWPEWHINRDEGVDENGWEYSFMFAKMFSWHLPRWYNSCVRRRAWTRQRVKRDPESNDPHMLNSEYFTVRRSMETERTAGRASSRNSRHSPSVISWVSAEAGAKPDIEDIDTLMAILTRSRIDREKIEAVENFLQHGGDELVHLQHRMHDIMAIFVFQASRRVLLAKLNEVFEQTQQELKENDTGTLQRRSNNLKGAIGHADEECRRLEYWSDVKKLVREGQSTTATDKCEGWTEDWRGVDQSGPCEPSKTT
ncbi:hypothetical protein KVR01_011517 [Diaporthe batatas]|uniref:uncharacterized protein n=1 Tax=Diaporthe batatas TaxID=748121 RepID=UPI001D0519CC|nr:uncharacterized protein KVR01_011517 [Diaporthe batatas]KAG8158395.1 hypothetical protein KVR01_011517 [Diaporthe batatas]